MESLKNNEQKEMLATVEGRKITVKINGKDIIYGTADNGYTRHTPFSHVDEEGTHAHWSSMEDNDGNLKSIYMEPGDLTKQELYDAVDLWAQKAKDCGYKVDDWVLSAKDFIEHDFNQ